METEITVEVLENITDAKNKLISNVLKSKKKF